MQTTLSSTSFPLCHQARITGIMCWVSVLASVSALGGQKDPGSCIPGVYLKRDITYQLGTHYVTGNMFQLFFLGVFFSPSWGLGERCIETQSTTKSHDPYPKLGDNCTSTQLEYRWRRELIYEILEDSSGIRVSWNHNVQRSDCDHVNWHSLWMSHVWQLCIQESTKIARWLISKQRKLLNWRLQLRFNQGIPHNSHYRHYRR